MSTDRDRKKGRVKTLHQDRKVFNGPKGKNSTDKIIEDIVARDIEENWDKAKANLGSNQIKGWQ